MYSYFDTHCDTLLKMYRENKSIFDETLMVNVKALSRYDKAVQCFSLFNDGSFTMSDFFDGANLLKKECDKYGMMICTCASDIDRCVNSGKIGAMLTIEGLGNTKDFTVHKLHLLKNHGYSMIGLVWNYDNFLCGGCHGNDTGFSSYGIETLREMEKLSIVVDVSHMSISSFYDVFDNFCKPIIASHSNCRKICNNKRNLTDDQIRKIIHSEGTVGLCFYPCFLGGVRADVSQLYLHAQHIVNLGGEGSLSLGSDFDGIDKTAHQLENCSMVKNYFNYLVGKNCPNSFICDVSFNNIYNVFKKYEILK